MDPSSTPETKEGIVYSAIEAVEEAQERDLEQGKQRDRNVEAFSELYPPASGNIPEFPSETIAENYDLLYEKSVEEGRALSRSRYSYELVETENDDFLLFQVGTYPIDGEYSILGVHEVPQEVVSYFERIHSSNQEE
ncbi:hypothetical protein [Alkalicoccus urumqiensis]|uniref:Uncharacterized protein n=1 Tax=Alkalicoccus urumqiensis TaxID=1548213 RepID=A0A2P6MDA5_ALKUR|nr:hypothetical protein [Alkalicoccus urumqiensis]PRO64250.1 hypothetical protein C6I21_15695 [Alkalicoccus urumqiensis]